MLSYSLLSAFFACPKYVTSQASRGKVIMCTTECNNYRSAESAYCFITFFVVSSVYYESWAFGMPVAIITVVTKVR